MPRHPFHSDAELSVTIRALMAQNGAVPTYKGVRAALGGPVSRDHLRNAVRKTRLTQIARPPATPTDASPSPARLQASAREVATLILRSLASRAGYRAPAFAEIKVAVQRTLDALEQSCQQHDTVVAPYIERTGQLEAEAAARGM